MKIPNIKNAYLNIQETCQKRLSEIYPHRIPEIAQNRLDKELAFAKNSKYLDDFEIYRQLSNEAQKCCLVFTLRGTLAGSYLTYLMGSGRFNPLPSHYYCQHCGHFETISTHLYGIDLPENICPECGSLMLGDGFNLSLESVWGLNGDKILSFDYNICEEFRPFAKKILTKIYPENEIVPWGVLSSPCGTIYEPSSFEVSHGGFVILPTGQTMDDYQELKTYLEDGEPCLSGFINILESHALKRITLLPLKAMEYLITLQRKTGIYVSEISIKELREITYHDFLNSRTLNQEEEYFFSNKKPRTYLEMIGYNCLSHNSYVNIEHDTDRRNQIYDLIIQSSEFNKYPCCTREDFFDYLIESGNTIEDAFKISELIRKGRANNSDFNDFQMPEELNTLAKRYTYIFPRAHVIEYSLINARLAYYMKQDSKTYSKIVFKNNKHKY